MKKYLFILLLLFSLTTKAQNPVEPAKEITPKDEPVKIEPSYLDNLSVYECTINKELTTFVLDSLTDGARISLLEANALKDAKGITNADLRLYEYFNMDEKPLKEGLRINLKEVKIGDLLLTNIDATIVKNQASPLILGKKIIAVIGDISTVKNKYKFTKITTEPYQPIKIDKSNEEFGLYKRTDLVTFSNEELRKKLLKNLIRSVNGYEKDKEFRITATFKADLYSNQDDEAYKNETTKKTMLQSFKIVNTSLETKSILSYYNTIVFVTTINYIDRSDRIKYSISKENFKKLPIPFTDEQFLELLTISK